MRLVSNTHRSQCVKHIFRWEPTSFNSNYRVLALVNSAASPTRPRSAALLPVSATFTGLLHLSVGARVHRVSSNTGNCCMWPQPCMQHSLCMTIIGIPRWAQLKPHSPKCGCRPTLVVTQVCKCGLQESQGRVICSHTRGFSSGSLCVCAAGVVHMTAYLEGKDELR